MGFFEFTKNASPLVVIATTEYIFSSTPYSLYYIHKMDIEQNYTHSAMLLKSMCNRVVVVTGVHQMQRKVGIRIGILGVGIIYFLHMYVFFLLKCVHGTIQRETCFFFVSYGAAHHFTIFMSRITM